MSFLLITHHDDITEIQLNRPPVNALSVAVVKEFKQALESAISSSTKGLLLSSLPGVFSAGMDLKELKGGCKATVAEMSDNMAAIMRLLAQSSIPIASAISGHAVAGGLVLNLFSDYRIMAEGDYHIGLNEAKINIPLPTLSMFALKEIVGLRQARLMVNEGLLLTPTQALEVGLVDQIVAAENVKTTALARLKTVVDLQSEGNLFMRNYLRQDLIEAASR